MNVLENGLKIYWTEVFENSLQCLVPTIDHVTLTPERGNFFQSLYRNADTKMWTKKEIF